MSVGIVAPYTWDETTRLAIAVADHLVDRGCDVHWLASQAQHSGVHNYWDRCVRPLKSANPTDWVRQRRCVLWFEDHSRWLPRRPHGKRVKQVRVVMAHRMVEENWRMLSGYDLAVFPSSLGAARFEQIRLDRAVVTWDVPVRLVSRGSSWARDPERLGLLVPLTGRAASSNGSSLFYMLHLLLSEIRGLFVTVIYTRQWKRASLDALTELQQRFPNRVTVLRKPEYHASLHTYLTHDWTLWIPTRDSSSIWAIESLAHGSPVISFDGPPVKEVVSNGHNGVLLPCELDSRDGFVEDISFTNEILFRGLYAALSNHTMVQQLESNAWVEREARRKAFAEQWATIVD